MGGAVVTNSGKYLRLLAVLLVCLLLLSLIPILCTSFYSYPAADDFDYATNTSAVWQETHSVSAVLSTAWEDTLQTYQHWQGSFVAIFLMCLQPGFIDTSWYFIGSFVLLFSFVFSSFFLFYTLAQKLLRCERMASVIIATILVFLSLQFTYDPVESFFWFNGGVYYTFFYSLCALLFSLLVRSFANAGKKRSIVQYVFCLPLAFLIGGGSFPPSLSSLIILALLALYFVWKRKSWQALKISLIFLAMSLSFFINVLAPGNALRQANAGDPNSPLIAIFLSLVYGAYAFCNCTSLPVITGWLFLTPFLYAAVSKAKFTFPYPLLFAGLLFGVFSSMGTPIFYALGTSMPERVINIIYFACYPFTLLVWSYFLGWLSHNSAWIAFLSTVKQQWKPAMAFTYFFLVICIGVSGTLGLIHIEKNPSNGKMQMSGLPLSVQAVVSLVTNESQEFHEQMLSREALYRDETIENVRVEPLSSKPYLLFMEDIQTDPNYWINQSLTGFFKKESIALISPD